MGFARIVATPHYGVHSKKREKKGTGSLYKILKDCRFRNKKTLNINKHNDKIS